MGFSILTQPFWDTPISTPGSRVYAAGEAGEACWGFRPQVSTCNLDPSNSEPGNARGNSWDKTPLEG